MESKNEFENHLFLKADELLATKFGLDERFSIKSIHVSRKVNMLKIDVAIDVPPLILIRGLPGSGKSTLARALGLKGYVHSEADQFFQKKYGYEWNASKLSTAHAKCFKDTRQALKAKKKVVVSNCFSKLCELIDYMKLSPSTLIIETNGDWKNIHGVKEETISKMAQSWQTFPSLRS